MYHRDKQYYNYIIIITPSSAVTAFRAFALFKTESLSGMNSF